MAPRADIPTYTGDLQHHAVGCYSAHSGVKRWNRRAEHLLMAAERWSTVADRLGGPAYPAEQLARAWKLVLFNQFHDTLAGTAIAPAYDDARDQYGYASHGGGRCAKPGRAVADKPRSHRARRWHHTSGRCKYSRRGRSVPTWSSNWTVRPQATSPPLTSKVVLPCPYHEGGAPMTSYIARKVVQAFQRQQSEKPEVNDLSPREWEVLELLSRGYAYKEISSALVISISTVNTHIHRVYEKLHVRSRGEAVAKFSSFPPRLPVSSTRAPR